jgi:hypothetical protein
VHHQRVVLQPGGGAVAAREGAAVGIMVIKKDKL